MVLPFWLRIKQYSCGSLKTSSWVTVHAIQAIGIANKNNHAVCVLNSMMIQIQMGKKVWVAFAIPMFGFGLSWTRDNYYTFRDLGLCSDCVLASNEKRGYTTLIEGNIFIYPPCLSTPNFVYLINRKSIRTQPAKNSTRRKYFSLAKSYFLTNNSFFST